MSAGDWKQLFQAAGSGDLGMVEYYIHAGIDPNYQHPEFLSTPLIESAQNGHAEIVEFLIKNGADPLIKSDLDGLTALETAQLYKQQRVVEILQGFKP